MTPLITSILSNKLQVADHLILLGADVNKYSDLYPPLYWAWMCKRVHNFQTLLDYGADPEDLLFLLTIKWQEKSLNISECHREMLRLIRKLYTGWYDVRGMLLVKKKRKDSILNKLPLYFLREVADYL